MKKAVVEGTLQVQYLKKPLFKKVTLDFKGGLGWSGQYKVITQYVLNYTV